MMMRGASAEALSALGDQLDRVLDSSAGTVDAARLGDDLFGVAAVLRAEPGLRRIATDVSTDADAKAGLVRGIFEGRLAAESLDILADAVRRRWTATRDLADALEHLGVVAVVRSVGGSDGGRLSDELFTVGQLISDNPELRNALSEPTRSVEDKRGFLRGLLDGRALPATVTLAEQSLSGSHRTVAVAIAEYQKVAASVHEESVAHVTVANALSSAEFARLQQALTRQYGRQVHVNVEVAPGLLGGMRVKIGDDVIDGTVAGRLDSARRKLAG